MVDDMKIGIVGAAGRMGQMCVRQVSEWQGCSVSGATEVSGHSALGHDAGEVSGIGNIGVPLTADSEKLVADADAVIDFTSPAVTVSHANLCM